MEQHGEGEVSRLASNPEIETIARRMCRDDGFDPDVKGVMWPIFMERETGVYSSVEVKREMNDYKTLFYPMWKMYVWEAEKQLDTAKQISYNPL